MELTNVPGLTAVETRLLLFQCYPPGQQDLPKMLAGAFFFAGFTFYIHVWEVCHVLPLDWILVTLILHTFTISPEAVVVQQLSKSGNSAPLQRQWSCPCTWHMRAVNPWPADNSWAWQSNVKQQSSQLLMCLRPCFTHKYPPIDSWAALETSF